MRAAITFVGILIWYPLQAVLITRLLHGAWRRFPLIFLFVIAELLVAVAEFPSVWAYYHGLPEAVSWRVSLYQRAEIFTQFLIFAVVLSLIFRATSSLQSRVLIQSGFLFGAALFVGISFLAHYDPRTNTGMWMTPWTRDLNVCATVLDLALWVLLMARREKDGRLLLLSGALGIQFTGQAMGNSLRTLAAGHHIRWLSLTGAIMVLAAGLIRIYIWGRAFRTAPDPRQPRVAAPAGI
jgi:hypothetical protein